MTGHIGKNRYERVMGDYVIGRITMPTAVSIAFDDDVARAWYDTPTLIYKDFDCEKDGLSELGLSKL